ncbi:MAG: phosphoglycerate dehydrogenase [Proteobacteria bacterium]|nr:phosphoglycerate dehydrogenase [Pseudomonadota bacterium]MBU4013887.1 phosphoglycerate dehydrogenase [Pseudomonadota bacterium]MBU4068180.1 phosphoglycerate dehydrogenase [Pseudomonadota bacterium]MBU4101087.1 phosphoglycerate dehydrogenase [Pseudomonadota bacterium]MBU4128250.1 phosphoglycerate dehydrogenase [Pseudomonadota bacterium]
MKIVITTSSFATYDRSPLDELKKKQIDYTINPYGRKLTSDEVIGLAKDADGLVAGTEPLNEDVLQNLPELKVISRCGVGLDNVDLEKAKELNIKVYSTPYGPTLAVAELTLGLMLDLLRKITAMDREIRKGLWKKQMGSLLTGKKVGIWGFGRIGQKVAQVLDPLGVEIAYYDIRIVEGAIPLKSKSELLSWADIITLHCSANTDGKHAIGEAELKLMKDNAWLINASRGGLVDETALYSALKKGNLAGAALDVFENEPYTGPLCELDNVILTPHIGSYAKEGRIQMEMQAVRNLINGLQNQ